MARGDAGDREDHFDWLVDGRSHNQRSTLALYKTIAKNENCLAKDFILHKAAQDLAAVAFSLWRAVFLCDLTENFADQSADVKRFLQNLIAHNAISYKTDYNAREWTFRYYLDNAQYRLSALSESANGALLSRDALKTKAEFAKDEWINTQAALDLAIATFAEKIADQS